MKFLGSFLRVYIENLQKTPFFVANFIYRTRAIITRGLYTFYPIFNGQKRLFKELFS